MAARRIPVTSSEDQECPVLRRREIDRWHIGKEIPLVLIAAVLVQTAGGIWWMAQLSSKIDSAVASISEFKADRYTREDARRDRELMDQKLTAYSKVDFELERRLNVVETRQARIEEDANARGREDRR